MTSRVRGPARRRFALVLAATLVGAPAVGGVIVGAAGPVSAAPAATVTFEGGCGVLGLGARSQPDQRDVSVPVDGQLRFANRLGQPASLLVDGAPVASVPDGAETDLTFHRGPVEISMQLTCLLGTPIGAVTVSVTDQPEPPVPPVPTPLPTTAPPADEGGPGSGGGDPRWSAGPGPGRTGEPGAPGAGVPAPPPEDSGVVADGGFSGAGGLPVDGPLSGPPDGGVPGSGLAGDPVTVGTPGAGEPAEFVRAARSGGDDGAIGLLALVATVCLVGASAGATRVLISQRSKSAKSA